MKYTDALRICPDIYGLRREALYMLKARIGGTVGIPVQLSHFYKDHIRFKVLSNPNRKGIVETVRKGRRRRMNMRSMGLNKHFDKEIEYFRLDYVNMSLYVILPIELTELPKYIATATPHLFKIFEQ